MCIENHIFSPPFCIYYITSMQECKAKAYALEYSPAARILRRASREQAPVGFGSNANPIRALCARSAVQRGLCPSQEKSRSLSQSAFFLYKGYEKDIFAFLNKVSNSNGYFFLKLARVTGTVNMSPWEPHPVDVATTQPFCSFISLANFFIPIL